MVNAIKKLIQQAKIEKGDVVLFMLWKDVADVDKWSVVISADWVDKIGQREALNYWLTLLQKNLSNKDLDSIGRISFLKSHDKFVEIFTSALSISGGPIYFRNNQVSYYIHDAIIFEAKKATFKGWPKNPILNGSINPKINGSINPNINYNFQGLFLYDLNLSRVAYLIEANDKILLVFDFNNNFMNFCVKAKCGFYNVFSMPNKWVGFMVSDSKDGFNYFDLKNNWIGFVK